MADDLPTHEVYRVIGGRYAFAPCWCAARRHHPVGQEVELVPDHTVSPDD